MNCNIAKRVTVVQDSLQWQALVLAYESRDSVVVYYSGVLLAYTVCRQN